MNLTTKQQTALSFIEGYVAANKFPPTYTEIADHMGIGKASAVQHVKALLRAGVITSRGEPRTIAITVLGWDTLDQIKASNKAL